MIESTYTIELLNKTADHDLEGEWTIIDVTMEQPMLLIKQMSDYRFRVKRTSPVKYINFSHDGNFDEIKGDAY